MDFLTLDDGTNRLSQKFGEELAISASEYPTRGQISPTLQWKPEITHPSKFILHI
jgi:hypothetical protein